MQAVQPSRQIGAEILFRYAKAGAGSAGIIDRVIPLGGTLRIHPHPHADFLPITYVMVLFQLRERIEYNMPADIRDLLHLLGFKRRGKDVVFLPHLLMAQLRLKQSAGRRAVQILPDERIFKKAGKRLLGQEDFAAGLLLHPL